jgi:hypothetical protein
MTGNTFVTGASRGVMGMSLNRRSVRAVRRRWPMALQAENVCRFEQISIVFRAVNIMATETANTVRVHGALDEIVTLHTVLMRGTVRKVSESLFA